MFKFERQVGRLFECVLVAPLTMKEFEDFRTACRMGFLAVPGSGVVLTDATQLSLLADDVAEQMLDLIKRNNPKIERGAYMVPRRLSSTTMQVTRLFRAAESEQRRVFYAKRSVERWLSPVLAPLEIARLRELLAAIELQT